jgi:hypothetical protein
MSDSSLPPNELADLYEGLFTVLEHLPEETHPGWRFAIESVLFGGEGLAENAHPYGLQQSERNEFHISAYRDEYGNGTHVTEFPTIEAERVTPVDEPSLDGPARLPVSPESKTVLPLVVNDHQFSTAIALLAEFPAEPKADKSGEEQQQFLASDLVAGVDDRHTPSEPSSAPSQSSDKSSSIAPNELTELYEALRHIYDSLPEDTHPVWEEALETILYGGETLLPGQNSYGKQQAERNDFRMRDYRDTYGDGDGVTTFSIIKRVPHDNVGELDTVLVSPESGSLIPLSPAFDSLKEALLVLEEFPSLPEAEDGTRSTGRILDTDQLLKKADLPRTREGAPDPNESGGQSGASSAEPTEAASVDSEISPDTDQTTTAHDKSETGHSESGEQTVVNNETTFERSAADDGSEGNPSHGDASLEETILELGVGETAEAPDRSESRTSGSQKYDDPRAQRAHEQARQRDPSEIVELGDEIKLVLQEVDHSSRGGTVMGRKNDLVIFVDEVPQDVSRLDAIHAKVVDYGSKNSCAHAVFTGYDE